MLEVEDLRQAKLIRVDEAQPCLICNSPKWCCRTADGRWALCSRNPSEYGKYGSFGWIHPGSGITTTGAKIEQGVPVDFTSLSKFYITQYSQAPAPLFGGASYPICDPGLAIMVRELGVGWNGEAYTIPMYSPEGWVCGIQRRYPDGSKRMVAGSKAGVFRSGYIWKYRRQSCTSLTIFEGASDLIYTYTSHAIGRLNCSSTEPVFAMLQQFPSLIQVQIMADNDPPGLVGAGELADTIRCHWPNIRVKVYVPRKKDWRAHVEAGYGWDELEVL